jgi:hypothetical protein
LSSFWQRLHVAAGEYFLGSENTVFQKAVEEQRLPLGFFEDSPPQN